MSKKVIFFIVVGVVIVAAGIAAYFLFFSDDTDEGNNTGGNTGGGTGNSGAGSLNINPNATAIGLGYGSTAVNQADTVGIAGADFTGLTEDNIKSRNVLTAAGSNPAKIHFTVAFNASCPAFVWYKNWLYAFDQSVQNSNTGIKTCYYSVKPSTLPAQLLVMAPTQGDCTNFKLYISGVEYKYVEKTSIVTGLGFPKLYCVYKK